MDHWDMIRVKARQQRAIICAATGGDMSAAALLSAADTLTGLRRVGVAPDDPLLYGAEAVLHSGVIWYRDDVEPWRALFYQAHEYAHYWHHGGVDSSFCAESDMDTEASEDGVPFGSQRVEGYGPHERRELEANVYAREFLLPGNELKRWFIDEGLDAAAIAARTGMPEGMVLHQLSRALLTPTTTAPEEKELSEADLTLDPSQRTAAYADRGPLLVEAGPGTGKTRALVGRILYLLKMKEPPVEPSSILTLTFSNKAAEEMRTRVAAAAPAEAPFIWMGTFHAFGLELLRKYGTKLGLPEKPAVIDPVDALFFMEGSLLELGLDHYQNLYDPAMFLRDILSAISRAKDELAGPADYQARAEEMWRDAKTEEDIEAAEKALEVARVYSFYQDYLERNHVLDFGDLIFKSVILLREHHDVRSDVRNKYPHILVDEYQDVNTASRLLLCELADTGEGLWVVGDARQAIYRFRGAAPVNMRLFTTDFPEANKVSLEVNHRSQEKIVSAFSSLATNMSVSAGSDFVRWESRRGDAGGKVWLEIAEDETAEAEGLAREIERQKRANIPYRDQAVLCRSHTILTRVSAVLEKEGIPALYLGNLFERPEVRDLLSLVALSCEPDGRGLLRVARFDEYGIPLSDVRALLALARERSIPFPRALSLAVELENISPAGKAGIEKLSGHLDGLCYGSSAWGLLTQYLFNRSGYLRSLLSEEGVIGQQKRLAIYQLLQFANDMRARFVRTGKDPKRGFLAYIRRLEIFGEEKQLRQTPAWADGIDAVRMLTMHASKGLEFSAVYLPYLSARYFPSPRHPDHCKLPPGLLPNADDNWHDEEEECLFFVAVSRARDLLCLSRARKYRSQNSNHSRLLSLISSALQEAVDGATTWKRREPAIELPGIVPPTKLPVFPERALGVYIDCPRQFYYEFVLGLSGRRQDSAYLQFHLCVYRALRWINEEISSGREITADTLQQKLDEIWDAHGPREHIYEAIYRGEAEKMIDRAFRRRSESRGRALDVEWEIPLTYGKVSLKPDHVEILEEGRNSVALIQRMRTGRRSKKEADKEIYALYQRAVQESDLKAQSRIQILYLATDEVEDVEMSAKKIGSRLEKYDAAMAGILQERFHPTRDDRLCPRCPHYFICPAGDGV
jgi:ATP-dependent DNA helicase UvrD/PcrA